MEREENRRADMGQSGRQGNKESKRQKQEVTVMESKDVTATLDYSSI